MAFHFFSVFTGQNILFHMTYYDYISLSVVLDLILPFALADLLYVSSAFTLADWQQWEELRSPRHCWWLYTAI